MEKESSLVCPNCNRPTFKYNSDEVFWICSTCWYSLNEDFNFGCEIQEMYNNSFSPNERKRQK